MTDDNRTKHIQGAEDRDLAGLEAKRARERRNAPAEGVPVHVEADEECTPVGHVLALIDQSEIDEDAKRPLKEHVANLAMRAHEASKRTDINRIADELDTLGDSVIDIAGKSGNNGKLGALRERVDKAEARRWWVLTALAGSVIALIASAITIGRWVGEVNTDLKTLKAFHTKEGSK